MLDTVLIFLLSMAATFVYVGLRAFQQLNVVNNHYWRIPIASVGMGLLDVTLALIIVRADTILIGFTNGVGGALGCYAAMWINKRWTYK